MLAINGHAKPLPWVSYNIALAIIALGLVVALIGVLYARPPRRRITIRRLPSVALSAPDYSVEVLKNHRMLAEPFLTNIIVANTGRRDITSADFDRYRPIVIDLGISVIDVKVHSIIESGLPVKAHDCTLEIGPGLIKVGSQISLRVISDGSIDKVDVQSYVINAAIDTEYGAETIRYQSRREKKRVVSNEAEKRSRLTVMSEISIIATLIVAILAWLYPRK